MSEPGLLSVERLISGAGESTQPKTNLVNANNSGDKTQGDQ